MRATVELVMLIGWGFVPMLFFRISRLRREVRRASHEIRGPLSAVQLGLFSISRDRCDSSGLSGIAALTSHLRRAELALEDLERTVLCNGDRDLDSTGSIDLQQLVLRVVGAWRPVAEESDRYLDIDWQAGDVVVRGNCARLEQALANLLANALEHGSGSVLVRSKEVDGRVHVEVNDQGQAQVLQPISRIGRGRRGHGLKIVSETVKRHGGSVRARLSSEGTNVSIDLPIAEMERCEAA